MPWPIMRSNPTMRIVQFRTAPAKRSRRSCAACGSSSPSCAPTMQPSLSRRALGDFPALPPRRPRRNSAPRSPRPKPVSKNFRLSTTLFLGACPWPRPKRDKRWLKLSTERKHLTNVLKMVAYHMESDLLELIRPHYKRVEEEGRTFIQAALACYRDPYLTENWSGSN